MSSTVLHYYSHMARTDPQMNLRFPAELKQLIEDAAKANNRSMNAEIVARLKSSFDCQSSGAGSAMESYYLLIDSSGYPISWSEIMAHMKGVSNARKIDPVDLKIDVVTPDMESSSRRAEETAKLAEFYRKQGRSMKINKT
jgi:hypothetical protein